MLIVVIDNQLAIMMDYVDIDEIRDFNPEEGHYYDEDAVLHLLLPPIPDVPQVLPNAHRKDTLLPYLAKNKEVKKHAWLTKEEIAALDIDEQDKQAIYDDQNFIKAVIRKHVDALSMRSQKGTIFQTFLCKVREHFQVEDNNIPRLKEFVKNHLYYRKRRERPRGYEENNVRRHQYPSDALEGNDLEHPQIGMDLCLLDHGFPVGKAKLMTYPCTNISLDESETPEEWMGVQMTLKKRGTQMAYLPSLKEPRKWEEIGKGSIMAWKREDVKTVDAYDKYMKAVEKENKALRQQRRKMKKNRPPQQSDFLVASEEVMIVEDVRNRQEEGIEDMDVEDVRNRQEEGIESVEQQESVVRESDRQNERVLRQDDLLQEMVRDEGGRERDWVSEIEEVVKKGVREQERVARNGAKKQERVARNGAKKQEKVARNGAKKQERIARNGAKKQERVARIGAKKQERVARKSTRQLKRCVKQLKKSVRDQERQERVGRVGVKVQKRIQKERERQKEVTAKRKGQEGLRLHQFVKVVFRRTRGKKELVDFYYGQIVDLQPDVIVSYLKNTTTDNVKVWPAKEDIYSVETQDIVALLPDPNIDSRMRLIFK